MIVKRHTDMHQPPSAAMSYNHHDLVCNTVYSGNTAAREIYSFCLRPQEDIPRVIPAICSLEHGGVFFIS